MIWWIKIANCPPTKQMTDRLDHICAHVPDSGELLTHWRHVFRANRHKCIHSKSGMAANQGNVVTGGLCIVIILLCVTSITLHLNNTT